MAPGDGPGDSSGAAEGALSGGASFGKHAAGPPGAHSADRGAKPPGREPFSESPASRERRYGLPGPTVNRIPRTAVDNPGDNLGKHRRAFVDIHRYPVDKPVNPAAAPLLTSGAKESWEIAENPSAGRLWTSFRRSGPAEAGRKGVQPLIWLTWQRTAPTGRPPGPAPPTRPSKCAVRRAVAGPSPRIAKVTERSC